MWRSRVEFFAGRNAIAVFGAPMEQGIGLPAHQGALAFDGNRIAVRFAYEWHDEMRKIGSVLTAMKTWNPTSGVHGRLASINDLPITEAERTYHWPLGPRPETMQGSRI